MPPLGMHRGTDRVRRPEFVGPWRWARPHPQEIADQGPLLLAGIKNRCFKASGCKLLQKRNITNDELCKKQWGEKWHT